MKKTIKYFISFITLFILLVFIYTIFFFNPDSFKDEIGEYISSKIQYKFTYNSTAWSYDPNPSISMKEIKIIDDSITPNKKIVDIEEAVIAISKENLMNQIIDAEEVAASNLIYYGVNIDEILMKTYSLIKFKPKSLSVIFVFNILIINKLNIAISAPLVSFIGVKSFINLNKK